MDTIAIWNTEFLLGKRPGPFVSSGSAPWTAMSPAASDARPLGSVEETPSSPQVGDSNALIVTMPSNQDSTPIVAEPPYIGHRDTGKHQTLLLAILIAVTLALGVLFFGLTR